MGKKLFCIFLSIVLAVSVTACGSAGSSEPAGDAATGAAKGDTGTASAEAETGTASKEAETESVLPEEKDIKAEDISVLWENSRVYTGTSLTKYATIATYAVKGFDDVPFIKVSEYISAVFEDQGETVMDDGVMRISRNGTTAVVDPEANTIHIEDPALFRSPSIDGRGVNGSVLDPEEVNVVTVSVKNKSTQTGTEPMDVALDDYHMPVLALEDDIIMPFMALQNTFGAITWRNVLAYNGKDYYNVSEVANASLEDGSNAEKSSYAKKLYSGPFSKMEEASKAYAEYAYYTTCLLMDYSYGHKEEKNITTFDEYFTRLNAKKSLLSTNPSTVQMAELTIFLYLFDSGHDAVMGNRSVFAQVEKEEEKDQVVEDMKQSEEGKELFEEGKESGSADSGENDLSETMIGALEEKGYKIPEVAPLMAWEYYMDFAKPKDYGSERLDYADDTAVIYFDTFSDDMERDPSYYLDMPKKEDEDKSNFAFFYRCFKDIKKHDEVKNVVINLSANGGGNAAGLIAVLGFLSDDGEVKMTDLDMTSNSYREEYYHVDTNLDGAADDKDGYGDKYDFFIMTSGSSYSCANALPYYAQQQGLAKIIGAKPGGGDCVVGNFTDAYGNSGAFSGILKLGKKDAGGFTSDEKAVTLDLDMMPSIIDIANVPWFKSEGIAEAVHQYKEGKKKITYPITGALEKLPDYLEGLLKQLDVE